MIKQVSDLENSQTKSADYPKLMKSSKSGNIYLVTSYGAGVCLAKGGVPYNNREIGVPGSVDMKILSDYNKPFTIQNVLE